VSNTQNHWNVLTRAFTLGILLLLCACSEPSQTSKDTTNQLEHLGNPFLEKPLMARNVWDMKVFDGQLYFGHGDAVANSGPIKLFRFETSSKNFISDFPVDDESINSFDVVGNQLLVAGFDPREAWELGNFYRLEQGVWQKHRTIPWGVHAYQLTEFEGKLFIGISTDHLHPSLLSSSDQGATWLDATGKQFLDRPFNKLIVLNNQLYATGLLKTGTVKLENGMFVDAKIPVEQIAPGLTPDAPMIVSKLEYFKSGVVYTVGKRQMYTADPTEERYETKAKAAFFSSNFQDTVPIPLPENSVPTDILLKDKLVLILTHRKLEVGFENIVIQSSDARSWTETLRFSSQGFARSFEFLNSQFYFGLGCYFTEQSCDANGDVLRFTP
jgi:hypothetical protein